MRHTAWVLRVSPTTVIIDGLSKTTTMHDLVIGLCVNRYECGLALYHEINPWETPSFLAEM